MMRAMSEQQTGELMQLPRMSWTPSMNGVETVIPAHLMMETALSRVRVRARGHIHVMQECYESSLTSELGSLFVMYGATRHSAFSAALNVFIKHAEEAELTAGNDIIIEESVRNSRLTAGRKIISESDRGRAVGGVLTAERCIELQALGSAAEAETDVHIASEDGFIVCRNVYPGVSITIGGVRRIFRKQAATGAVYRKIFRKEKQLYLSAVTRETNGDEVCYIPSGRPEPLLNP